MGCGQISPAPKRHRAVQGAASEDALDSRIKNFDQDRSYQLDRTELRQLLNAVEPASPATDHALDFLMGFHPRLVNEGIRFTVCKYVEYCKRSSFLDEVFDTFDVDKSGTLETEDVHRFLKALADGTSVCQGAEEYAKEEHRVLKLRALACALRCGAVSRSGAGGELQVDRVGFKKILISAMPRQSFEVHCEDRRDAFARIAVWLGLADDDESPRGADSFDESVRPSAAVKADDGAGRAASYTAEYDDPIGRVSDDGASDVRGRVLLARRRGAAHVSSSCALS
ncbi:hypothetical protein M885DRAFT_551175 [Pelagophyceae sp. CCMP2097]|nr:hypothetical protein M885DRAFT_551175 [Pelagophyceae sp. CCMP2097]|mmetsp:Transcript_12092/g.40335  ORF Transcript_12092/g.40335 Transcript_12092/m.40335 type:complete len:283 (+) Transcript_12092:255-1103(+)